MNILNKVKTNITQNNLIEKGDKVLVALSGGSDSVAMLDMLVLLSYEMGFSVCAAHVNHNIRKEAQDDENFVKNLCSKMNIKCYVKSVNVPEYAKNNSLSEELAGRKIRYDFFDELREKHKITKIATAHNKNDSAESIMLHLIRGCGPDGLSGIPVIRNGNIIRPILNITKAEVEEYCKENKLSYVVDKTNFTTDYARNKIRLELIPLIERELNANFTDTITSNASIFKEVSEFIAKESDIKFNNLVKDGIVSVKKLLCEDVAIVRLIIQKMYMEFALTNEKLSQRYIDKIITVIKDSQPQKTINLPGKVSARYESDKLFFEKTQKEKLFYDYVLTENEELFIKECEMTFKIKKEDEQRTNTKNKIYFYINSEDELHIRNRRDGDVFLPTGMTGSKKVSDLFCDMKLPSKERNILPILVQSNDIIWIVGIRSDRRFLKGKKLMSCEMLERRNIDAKKH